MGPSFKALAAASFATLLAACGGLSEVGNQESADAGPTADALVLNQPFSKDSTGNVTTRVRSGAEVFLSGNDSDGTVAPVLKLDWTLVTTGAVASQVQLVDRNSSTVSFKAPQVAADTPLQFRLTVTDSNGKTDQAEVQVTVVAVADPDRFLTHLQAPHKFTVVAVADSATALTADVPFEISMQRTVSYVDLRGLTRTATPAAETLQGTWIATEGAGAACEDHQNPRFAIDLPKLDVNSLSAAVRADRNRTASELPDLSRIDSATTSVTFTIRQTGAPLPQDRQALVCVLDASGIPLPDEAVQSLSGRMSKPGGYLGSFRADAHALTGNLQNVEKTVDTRNSAEKYYATIDDPAAAQRKRSFLGWLKDNGFVPANATLLQWSQVEAGSTAHAVYVNNFDLGFGRDMYARRFNCVDPLSTTGECVASVVVNYGSMEAAAKKLDPILAVAMEYTASPHSNGRRIVKFYTYAPNETSGDFDRIHSVDLDGRGEKFMPGSCTICHGGTPQGIDPVDPNLYAQGGDVNATFLPWDLESFLYSDSQAAAWRPDPTDANEAALHAKFTRSVQEGAFRELNRLAYQTYGDDPAHPGRHDAARDLVEAWYGDAVDSATFQNRVPAEWGTDPAAQDIYRRVFAQHCRMCHIAHVPNLDAQTGEHQPYLGCNQTPRAPYASNVAGQVAFNCYDQFIAANNLVDVIQRGVMPNARLTMDRFWVHGGSGDSPAKVMATHLQAATGRTDVLDSTGEPVKPGRPVLDVRLNDILFEGGPRTVPRHATARADATRSQLIARHDWSLCLVPPGQSACAALPLVGATTAHPSFTPRAAGEYRLTLAATSALGLRREETYIARVDNREPNITSCPTLAGAPNGTPDTISLDGCIGDGDGPSRVELQDPVTLQWASRVDTGSYGASVSGKVITFTHAETATDPAALNYRVCDEDPEDCKAAQLTVSIDSTHAPDGDSFSACLPYNLPPAIAATVSCPAVLPLALPVNTLLLGDTIRPANDAVTLAILGQPAHGMVDPESGVQGDTLTYSSIDVTCDIEGQSIEDGTSPCLGDRFQYRLRGADGTWSEPATVVIAVRATTSFRQGTNSIHSAFGTCQGCHYRDGEDSGSGAGAWIRTASDASATLTSIRSGGFLNGNTPQANLLYRAPCLGELGGTAGAHTTAALTANQCLVLLQWMREGENLW